MNKVIDYFNAHPKEHNMNYCTHFCFSLSLSVYYITLSVKAFIHAVNPNWFEKSSTNSIKELKMLMNIEDKN